MWSIVVVINQILKLHYLQASEDMIKFTMTSHSQKNNIPFPINIRRKEIMVLRMTNLSS